MNNSNDRREHTKFTEVRSQLVIYVLPRPPQDLLPLFVIRNYNVGVGYSSAQLTFTPSGFVQAPLKLPSVLLTRGNTQTLKCLAFYKRNTQKLSPSVFGQVTLKLARMKVYKVLR